MKYRFVKIRRKGSDKTNWYFNPRSEEQLLEHFKKIFGAEIRDGVRDHIRGTHLKKDPHGSDKPWVIHDHPSTPWARAVDVYWQLHGGLWIDAATRLENETLQQRLKSFRSGKVMLLDNGVVETRICDGDEILEDVEKDAIEYPVECGARLEDVRYMKWDMPDFHIKGTHWYAKIGKQDIVDKDGNTKWDTRAEAENAAKWFLEHKFTWKRYND